MARSAKSLHLTAVERQRKLKKMASKNRLRVVNGLVEIYDAAPVAKDSETAVAVAQAADQRALAEIMATAKPGQLLPDGTVYLGKYTPKDRRGRSLRETFHVAAAPQDLQKDGKRAVQSYNETVAHVAALENWHGYNGAKFKNDSEIYRALREGTYDGGWIIPTIDILRGADPELDIDDNPTMPDNLRAHKSKGDFKNTFQRATYGYNNYYRKPDYYWSSSAPKDVRSYAGRARVSDGDWFWSDKNEHFSSCRVVRLMPALN